MGHLEDLPNFPEVSYDDWQNTVINSLKNTSISQLQKKTLDGINISPLYRQYTGQHKINLNKLIDTKEWIISQRLDIADPILANQQIKEDLENGVNGISLVFPKAVTANNNGILTTKNNLKKSLNNVYLGLLETRIDAGTDSLNIASKVLALYNKEDIDTNARVSLGIDYAAHFALNGNSDLKISNKDKIKELLNTIEKLAIKSSIFTADTRAYHGSGASEAQELGFAIATAVDNIKLLKEAGLTINEAVNKIDFLLTTDSNQFLSIAKIRAMRILWAKILQELKVDKFNHAHIHVETSYRMLTCNDPYTNILRNSIACFAASIGGANTITVLPFTSAIGLPNAFARRNSRNIQIILQEEANIRKVTDVGAGSGIIEHLTHEFCQKAWSIFQEIEVKGGMMQAISNGYIKRIIEPMRNKILQKYATLEHLITGISSFPILDESKIDILKKNTQRNYNLPQIRVSEQFEAIRLISDKIFIRTGQRPKAFIINIGSVSDFKIRNDFIKNILNIGGIEIEEFTYTEKNNFANSNTNIAIICATDKLYQANAFNLAKNLQDSGFEHISIVSNNIKVKNINDYIYRGINIVEYIQKLYNVIEK